MAAKPDPCENISIYYGLATLEGSWRLPFRTQNRLENATCTRCVLFRSFMPTLGAKATAKVAPRQARGSPKGPKGVPGPLPGRQKTIKKSTRDPTWGLKGIREAPGVPREGKRHQNRLQNVCSTPPRGLKKGEHSVLFQNHFGCENRRHSTKAVETHCPAQR